MDADVPKKKLQILPEKLTGLNDSIENVLDRSDIGDLKDMQQQTYMAVLQLNGKVEKL